eukprot:212756-Prorocentrum_minimum.AAC.1
MSVSSPSGISPAAAGGGVTGRVSGGCQEGVRRGSGGGQERNLTGSGAPLVHLQAIADRHDFLLHALHPHLRRVAAVTYS